jgi:hypothetical protein
MEPPTASQSSLATALDELTARLAGIAEQLDGTAHDLMAGELFEVERALSSAQRRLAQLLKRAG